MTADPGAAGGTPAPAPDGGGQPGVDDLDPAAALGAAIIGGTVTPDPDADDDGGADPEKLARERDKWKALSRKNEARARENSAAAAKLAELEDRDKTELQRATDRAVKAEQRADAAERRGWIADAADSYEIPKQFRNRITGTTEEEITASAEDLAKALNEMRAELGQAPAPVPGARGRRPVESMRSGGAPSGNGQVAGTGNDILRGMLDRARGR